MATSSSVDQLNSFLRGEISAVETYRLALERLQGTGIESTLLECQRSHAQRVDALRAMIARLGGQPAEGSGAWGAFAKAVQGSAGALGKDAAIATLEEGEDHGLADYKRDIDKLDMEARSLVETQLLPAQQQTHRAMSTLKRTTNLD